MYLEGEEFERFIEDELEYLTCIGNINIGEKEYLICENENGIKRVFYYDVYDDDIELIDEYKADHIIELWEDDYYGTDREYMYWNEESDEYDEVEEEENFEEIDYDDYDSEDYDSDDYDSEDYTSEDYDSDPYKEYMYWNEESDEYDEIEGRSFDEMGSRDYTSDDKYSNTSDYDEDDLDDFLDDFLGDKE